MPKFCELKYYGGVYIMKMVENEKPSFIKRIKLLSIAKGIIISYIITVPILALFAYLLTYTNFPEKYMAPTVLIATLISIFIAGSVSTREIGSRGWLNGAIVGFLYIFVLYILSSILLTDFSVNKHVISMTIVGILAGSIGGIIGINIRVKSHHKYKKIKKKI